MKYCFERVVLVVTKLSLLNEIKIGITMVNFLI